MTSQTRYVYLRGPLILLLSFVSIILPFLHNVSLLLLLKISFLAAGFGLFCLDSQQVAVAEFRRSAKGVLASFIIDDVMRLFFDPETGIVACLMGTIVGNAAMYTIPLSDNQRIKLVQATMCVNEKDARSILYEPGGCQLLLPPTVLEWLEGGRNDDATKESLEEETETSSSSSSASGSVGKPQCAGKETEEVKESTMKTTEDERTLASTVDMDGNMSPARDSIIETSPSISDAVASIFKEHLAASIKQTLFARSGSELKVMALGAAAALVFHLRLSKRMQNLLLGMMETVTFSSITTVGLGAFTMLASRQLYGTPEEETLPGQSLPRRLVAKIRVMLRNPRSLSINHLQGILVAFVVLSMGIRRHSHRIGFRK